MILYSFFIIYCFSVPLLIVATDGATCDSHVMANIYREIQCTPKFDSSDIQKQCPIAYDCPVFSEMYKNPTKCYWNNEQYEVGNRLPNELTEPDCFAACYCSSKGGASSSASLLAGFKCARIECPHDMGHTDIPEPGCYYERNIRKCCPSSLICPHEDLIVRRDCTVGTEVIMHGKRVEPPNNDCKRCFCNDGKVECKELNCGTQLLHLTDLANGVGLLFYGRKRCCPIGYVRPSGNDSIRSLSRQNTDPSLSCKFGNLTVGMGEEVITSETNNQTKCACLVPPLLTCIQEPEP